MKLVFLLLTFISLSFSTPELGLSFPPVSSVEYVDITISNLQDFKSKYIRFSDDWIYRELSLNVLNWGALDYRIQTLHNAGIKIMLTLESNGPSWRCSATQINARACVYNDTAVFRVFARLWMTQVYQYVDIVQFGNEFATEFYYPGSIRQYAMSHKIFCEEAATRNIPCALGGLSNGIVKAITACNGGIGFYLTDSGQTYTDLPGSPVDLSDTCSSVFASSVLYSLDSIIAITQAQYIDIHLYGDPTYWPTYVTFIQNRYPNKQWIISEFGGVQRVDPSRVGAITATLRARQTRLQLNTILALPISLALYFQVYEDAASVSPFSSYLIDQYLVTTPAYKVFKNTSSQPHVP